MPPTVAAKFYLAVVQAVLLYGSETWVTSPQVMAQLEGFHIRAWRMTRRHKPRRGPRKEYEDDSGVCSDPPADDRGVRCD
jgi:hypothetical protein